MIQGKLKYDKLELKRFYLPGLELNHTCTHCSHNFNISLENHYPYQLKEDGSCFLSFLCPKCEEGCDLEMQLHISLNHKK